LRTSKWLELPEEVVAISSERMGLDFERKINEEAMAVIAISSKFTEDRPPAVVVP